jgi:hypothetical protein
MMQEPISWTTLQLGQRRARIHRKSRHTFAWANALCLITAPSTVAAQITRICPGQLHTTSGPSRMSQMVTISRESRCMRTY